MYFHLPWKYGRTSCNKSAAVSMHSLLGTLCVTSQFIDAFHLIIFTTEFLKSGILDNEEQNPNNSNWGTFYQNHASFFSNSSIFLKIVMNSSKFYSWAQFFIKFSEMYFKFNVKLVIQFDKKNMHFLGTFETSVSVY